MLMSNDLIYICYVPANLTMGAFYPPAIIDKRCFISSTVKKLTLAPVRKLQFMINPSIQSNHELTMHNAYNMPVLLYSHL